MSDRLRLPVLALCALALAACRGGAAPAHAPTSTATADVRRTLPPAWTETPSLTPVPPTPTATGTLRPEILAARQTSTAWPTLHVVAVGAGADATGWERIASASGSFLMPSTFEAEDLRRVDREMQASLQAYVAALTDLNREVPTLAPGQATPTPIPIRTLGPATGFDIVAASDPASQAEVILVAGPIPSWLDLPTLMTTAHSGLPGEVEVGGQEIVGGAPRETGRLYITLYDRSRGTVDPRLYYFTIEGGRMWTLIFRAPDLDPLLPVFETAALSLTPAP